jgi:hypothetical protein
MTYGALNKNDVGTDMHVLIHGKYDPDFSKGSKLPGEKFIKNEGPQLKGPY